jgi:hypothetical protein
MLLLGVLCLVITDVIILTVFTIVDRQNLAAVNVDNGERQQETGVC